MNRLKILILQNKLQVNVKDDCERWLAYEADKLGIELDIDFKESSISPLKHKSFGIVNTKVGVQTDMFGLDNIKPIIRAAKIVPEGMYHIVIFAYDYESTDLYKSTQRNNVGHWTYFDELYKGTEFIEIATTRSWDSDNDFYRVVTHEFRHACVNRVRRREIAIADVMDSTFTVVDCDNHQYDPVGKCLGFVPYLKEYDVGAIDGNRAIQSSILKPYVYAIVAAPELTGYIGILKKLLADLQAKLKTLMGNDETGLTRWAEAIKLHEGWYVGSRSYRNNNPANFRLAPFIKELGAIGEDRQGVPTGQNGYAIFPSYEKGFAALKEFLRTAQKNQLKAYREYAIKMRRADNMPQLRDFFEVYAPSSDNNAPLHYATVVAEHIGNGVKVDTPINKI
jgi:hypothetical protein